MTPKYNLPLHYHEIPFYERKFVRVQYIEEQEGLCWHCHSDINKSPPEEILKKAIHWSLFPTGFMKNPIHLQHDHVTGLTEGAVHAYCNAVLWQYHGR